MVGKSESLPIIIPTRGEDIGERGKGKGRREKDGGWGMGTEGKRQKGKG
jgi:hypothetical protein